MLDHNIFYKNFKTINNKLKKKKILGDLKKINNNSNQIFASLKKNYKDSYDKKLISRLKKFNYFNIIGMGGSILGAKAIYNFLQPKFKYFKFIDNFSEINVQKNKKKKSLLLFPNLEILWKLYLI